MSSKLRFGLVGCGDFGLHFTDYLREVADISALCDVKEENTAALAKQHHLDVPRYTNYRTMFDAGNLDAVAITAANFVHCEIACAAAQAGLHVYCEKAMARTVPECWQMVRASQKNNVKLMVGHKRRLRPPWARMIELTDDVLLGKPLAITVTQYTDMRPYSYKGTWWAKKELGGGPFHLLGVHVIDWFRAMCGDARIVTAMFGPQHDEIFDYRDIIHATFQFTSGALASIHGSMLFPIHKFREAHGPWGQCQHGGFKLVPHLDHIDLYWMRLDEDDMHHERFDDLGFDHAFRLEVGDFVRWITEDRKPCLTWVEGLRCVEMMEAAFRSAEQGGQAVHFPLYPELEDNVT